MPSLLAGASRSFEANSPFYLISAMTLVLRPPTSSTLARQANLEKRNLAIREAFYKRFTMQVRPRIYTREYVLSQLAQEYHLSIATLERLVMLKVT
jgi:hypothetical protein